MNKTANRHERRKIAALTGRKMERGFQELIRDPRSGELVTKKCVFTEIKRKSRAGIEYISYKQTNP